MDFVHLDQTVPFNNIIINKYYKDYHLKIFIDEDAAAISNGNTNKVIRCNKCKEIGHKSNNCFYA